MTRRVFIECTGYGPAGARYQVADEEGRVLLTGSRTPAFDAARALLAAGATGRLEIWRASATYPAMVVDIERGAGLTVEESATVSPTIRKWQARDEPGLPERDAERSACPFLSER